MFISNGFLRIIVFISGTMYMLLYGRVKQRHRITLSHITHNLCRAQVSLSVGMSNKNKTKKRNPLPHPALKSAESSINQSYVRRRT